jgi:hypothetical protein
MNFHAPAFTSVCLSTACSLLSTEFKRLRDIVDWCVRASSLQMERRSAGVAVNRRAGVRSRFAPSLQP